MGQSLEDDVLFLRIICGPDKFYIFGRVFIEIFFTIRAAKFHFLSLINKDIWLAHFTQFIARNRACRKQIRFGGSRACRISLIGTKSRRYRNKRQCHQNSCNELEPFHVQLINMKGEFSQRLGTPGGGSLIIAQNTPICFTDSTNFWKSTGFTT
jgi:hypothetical protein